MSTRDAPERTGQIVVIFAVALVAIALMVGLVVDGGMAFFQRRDGQNDADLAALAATQVVANVQMGESSGPSVVDTIATSLQGNGCRPAGGTPCTWTAHYSGLAGATSGRSAQGRSPAPSWASVSMSPVRRARSSSAWSDRTPGGSTRRRRR